MGARQVEYRPLDGLQPNPDNAKRHDTEGINASISRFGLVDLIVEDGRTGWIVAGHGRAETLRARRDRGEPPPPDVRVEADGAWWVPVVTGWASRDDNEALAATVALNRWTERGGWDLGGLADRLERYAAAPDGLAGIGFETGDLDDLLAQLEEAGADDDEWQPDGERQVRSIMLDLPLEDYRWATETCVAARAHYGVDSNAALFLELLREDAAQAGGAR